MSDLLRLLSWIQTAASAKSIARTVVGILIAIVIFQLWTAESSLARFIGFSGVDIAICLAIFIFLQAPVEVTQWFFIQLVYGMLTMSRFLIKIILMGVAATLSLIYFISPIDIIPDILLGLGWIDDALVAFGLISYASRSNYSVPIPSMSIDEASRHPAWKLAMIATTGTILTIILRSAT